VPPAGKLVAPGFLARCSPRRPSFEDPPRPFIALADELLVLPPKLVVLAAESLQSPESRPKDRGENDRAEEGDGEERSSDVGYRDALTPAERRLRLLLAT